MRAIIALSILCACGVPGPRLPNVGPQATASAWIRALERGDFGTMHDLTRPCDRAPATGLSIIELSQTENAEFEAVLRRHGLGAPPKADIFFEDRDVAIRALTRYLRDVDDLRALSIDVMAFCAREIDAEGNHELPSAWHVHGDHASTQAGGALSEFERIDGVWYVALGWELTPADGDVHADDR